MKMNKTNRKRNGHNWDIQCDMDYSSLKTDTTLEAEPKKNTT
jgi:hypothetical protein